MRLRGWGFLLCCVDGRGLGSARPAQLQAGPGVRRRAYRGHTPHTSLHPLLVVEPCTLPVMSWELETLFCHISFF